MLIFFLTQNMSSGNNIKHIFILVFAFLMPGRIVSTTRRIILKKTCTDLNTMRVLFGISLESCVEECQRRKSCSAVMYRHGINECALKYLMEWSLQTDKEPFCVFTNITGRQSKRLGECSERICGKTQRCKTSHSVSATIQQCITTECPTPQNISNTKLFSNVLAVGYRNGYKCDKGYVGVGDPFIACRNNGIWKVNTFACVARGTAPNKTFENGELISAVGEKWFQGTVIQFQCRAGFQGQGANATSMINGQGEWEPKVVQCCNDNSTDIWEDSCIARFNSSAFGSYLELLSFCENSGGKMKWLSPSDAGYMFGSGEYLWLMTISKKASFGEMYNLTLCLDENMTFDELRNFSNYTYDSLVKEVVSRELTGQNCDKARWWAPGQPDGGSEEDCIVFNYVAFGMHDVRCDLSFQGIEHVGFVCDYSLPLI